MPKSFKQFIGEADCPRMVGDKSGGVFRKMKTAVGHSLPNPVRNGITALGVTGKMMGADTEHDKNRYSEFRQKLLSRRKLPKFNDS